MLWVDQQQPRGTTVAFALRRDYCRKKAALLHVYTAHAARGRRGCTRSAMFSYEVRILRYVWSRHAKAILAYATATTAEYNTAPYVEELKSSGSVGRKHHVPGVAPLHIVRVLCASHRQQNGGDGTKRPDRGLLLPHSRTFYQDPSCAGRVLLLRCPPYQRCNNVPCTATYQIETRSEVNQCTGLLSAGEITLYAAKHAPLASPHLPRRRPSFPLSTSKEPGGWSGRTAPPFAAPCWRSAPGRTGGTRVPWEQPGRQKRRLHLWLLFGVVAESREFETRHKTQHAPCCGRRGGCK